MATVQEMVWFLKISLPLGIFNNQFSVATFKNFTQVCRHSN